MVPIILFTRKLLTIVFALLVLVIPSTGHGQVTDLYEICSDTATYTGGTQFQSNLNRLLYNDGSGSIFSNKTQGEEPDKVYGLFLCRGDVSAADCKDCIHIARKEILKRCPFRKEAIIWSDKCMIGYSNRSFFSTMETQLFVCFKNGQNITEPDKFTKIMDKMFANLTSSASSIPSNHMYAADEADIGNSTKLYGMVQCTPDLSPALCSNCLDSIVSRARACCGGKRGGRIIAPSCKPVTYGMSFTRSWRTLLLQQRLRQPMEIKEK